MPGVWYLAADFTARHRTLAVALTSTFSSTFLAVALSLTLTGSPRTPVLLRLLSAPVLGWWVAFVASSALLAVAAEVPQRYTHIGIIDKLLPIIHRALELGATDRITIHYVLSRERYQQLVNYHPTNAGRGREFSFSHGIVGHVIKNGKPYAWSIPAAQTFEQAMGDRWSFTQDEMSRLTRERASFLAYPIFVAGSVRAVVFLDSSDAARFDDTTMDKYQKELRVFGDELELLLA